MAAASGVQPLLSPAVDAPPEVQQQLREHRHCAPEHTSLVRRSCLQDPSVLPRWHQDDRGRRNEHRGVHVLAGKGAYSRITAWNSRHDWLAFVVPTAIALNRDLLRKHHVSAHMFQQWALVKSGYAHSRTGRQCIVRPDTLAGVLGCSERHVERMNHLAREIGLEVGVLEGRMLTQDESLAARRRGSPQRGLSTEVALTTPRVVVDSVTPTSGPPTTRKSCGNQSSLHGPRAEKKGSATPTQRQRSRWRHRRARQLAADLIATVPWLASERPGNMAPALTRFANADAPWTSQDLVNAIATHNQRTGRSSPDPAKIRTRPAAVLAAILREIDPQADNPALALPVQPCQRTDCDGHGWIELPDGRVAKCPDCPPILRAPRRAATDENDPSRDPEDPPF